MTTKKLRRTRTKNFCCPICSDSIQDVQETRMRADYVYRTRVCECGVKVRTRETISLVHIPSNYDGPISIGEIVLSKIPYEI